MAELNNRWFNGQAVHAELSPVTDFRESCCRQYEMGYDSTRVGWAPGVPDSYVLGRLSLAMVSSICASSTQGMYPWWLLQLHASATHLPEPPAAALWSGTQAQVLQDQTTKTFHALRLLYQMNLSLLPDNRVSSVLYPKTSSGPHPNTST